MCLGIPMCVIEAGPFEAVCKRGSELHAIDTRLVGPVQPGDWVMTFLGAAREHISADDAEKINAALAALEVVRTGSGGVDHLFADLVNREPQLPELLRKHQTGDLQ